jgi:uncharacterized protein YutE (UPF0331/DUF86 family)
MTNISTIENKISSVKKYLKILDRYKDYSQKKIVDDINLRGATERYLYLACQATIDLAEAVVSFRGFRKPAELSESFYILQEEDIIDETLTSNLVSMVGFRNIIAHDYEKINYDIMYNILQNRLNDISNFIKEIENLLNIRG